MSAATVLPRIADLDIRAVWSALGGGPLRADRGRAFWRDGDGFNVALDVGVWFDHGRNIGGGVLDLVKVALGCDQRAALGWLAEHFGGDTVAAAPAKVMSAKNSLGPIVAQYIYTDEQGTPVLRVTRHKPKTFRQWQPNGAGDWITGIGDSRRPLYRLPEVMGASIVFIVEGEKDVETLRGYGFVATCNPMGAGRWREEYNPIFSGKIVVLIADRDAPGEAHAERVYAGVNQFAVEVLKFNLETAKDVTEWFEQGHSEVELMDILEAYWTAGEGINHG